MKTIISTIIISLVLNSQVFSQEETLVGNGKVEHGGFGGPVIRFSTIKGEAGVLVGGRGGWIINHTFILGGGGYGLVNNIEADDFFFGRKPFLNFGYGGFEMEYILRSDDLIHFSVYTLIGGGGITYRERNWENWNRDNNIFGNDAFFVLEPALNVELNIISFFRLNAGVSYRFISGLEFDTLTNEDLSGPSATLTLKFGKF